MATRTEIETFAKSDWSRASVETERKMRLDGDGGAVSSDITEDAQKYTLTTVWNLD